MAYKIYRFEFYTGVHFGKNDLTESNITFCADTVFSALCMEAIRHSQQCLDEFVGYAKSGDILLSDAFPYIGDTYYVPKPFVRIQTEEKSNSIRKKALKKLKYIPLDNMDEFLQGTLDVEKEKDKFKNFGDFQLKTQAYVQEGKDALPYHVGTYYYHAGNGLYLLVQCRHEKAEKLLEELLTKLSYTGIGGERSSGLGRFHIEKRTVSPKIEQYLTRTSKKYMALSLCLPRDDEMENALDGASYSLIRRSGFVASESYAKVPKKKSNLYVCEAGSCFCKKFDGDVYDVSSGDGNHPVYRYAKAFLLGVTG